MQVASGYCARMWPGVIYNQAPPRHHSWSLVDQYDKRDVKNEDRLLQYKSSTIAGMFNDALNRDPLTNNVTVVDGERNDDGEYYIPLQFPPGTPRWAVLGDMVSISCSHTHKHTLTPPPTHTVV